MPFCRISTKAFSAVGSAVSVTRVQKTHASGFYVHVRWKPIGISDVYWNYKMIEQVNGHWEFNLRDYAWPIVLYYCKLFRALCMSISAFSNVRVRTFVTWCWLWLVSLWPLYVTCDNVVGKTTILSIAVPFEWQMIPRHRNGVGRVLFELGSNRPKAQAADLKYLN